MAEIDDRVEAAWNDFLRGLGDHEREMLTGGGGIWDSEEVARQQKNIKDQLRAGMVQQDKELGTNPSYEYGGQQGKAAADAEYFRRKAEESQNRPGVQVDYGRANQWDTAAGEDRLAGYESRGRAMSMADLMAARARGETPSIAGMRADLDIGRGIADQSSIAASARGPAAMALASQQAGNNSAALTQRISNDAQVNTAQERADAEKNALAGYAGIRAGDTAQQGADLGGAAAAAQRAQSQAAFDDAQRGRNDAREQNMYGNEMGVNTTQLQAQQNKEAARTGKQMMQIQQRQAANERADANMMGAIGAGTNFMAGVATLGSDERLKDPAPSPDAFEQKKAAAHAALDQYQAAQQPMAVEGFSPGGGGNPMGALRRRDEEDAGLARAKQRHGIELTDKEERAASSAERRMGIEKKAGAKVGMPEQKPITMADRLSKGLAAAGTGAAKALGQASQRRSTLELQMPKFQPITGYRQPSGMQMKEPVEMPVAPMPAGPLARDAFGAMNGINANLDAGPSTMGALNRQPEIQTFPSDPAAKMAAKRDGFMDGMQYGAGNSKQFPDYMPNRPVTGIKGVNGIKAVMQKPATYAGKDPNAPGTPRTEVDDRMDAQRAKFEEQAPGQAAAQDERMSRRFPEVPTEEAADANRALASSAYTYKPEHADKAGQPPGEVNVGPMTQRMEQSPIAATAVKHDEQGMGMIDVPKYTKVLGAGLNAAQKQIDEDRKRISFLMSRLRGNR